MLFFSGNLQYTIAMRLCFYFNLKELAKKEIKKNCRQSMYKKNKIKHDSFFKALYHIKSLIPALARDII